MKRMIFALILCAVILGGGVCLDTYLKKTSDDILTKVKDITAEAESGRDVSGRVKELQAFWDEKTRALRIFWARGRITEIDMVMAGVDARQHAKDSEGLIEDLEKIYNLTSNLYKQERFSLWNIL